jgi:monoamine oxidase
MPFGVFSDERYHVIDGNDRIIQALTSQLSNQLHLDRRLVKVHKTSTGRIELTFKHGARTLLRTYVAVVLAMPYTLLCEVELHAYLGLPPAKLSASNQLAYRTNAKMMVGFSRRLRLQPRTSGRLQARRTMWIATSGKNRPWRRGQERPPAHPRIGPGSVWPTGRPPCVGRRRPAPDGLANGQRGTTGASFSWGVTVVSSAEMAA